MTLARRELRLFVSSTFRDLARERAALVDVFRRVRQRAAARGVVFTEIDLRWGLTDERKAYEGPLPLCFDEIDRCRPFFLGLIGERYGSTPQQIPAELVQRVPWLAEMHGCSNTELEFHYGPLRDPKTAKQALFYYKQSDSNSPARRERSAHESAKLRQLFDQVHAAHDAGWLGRTPQPFIGAWDLAGVVERHLFELLDANFPIQLVDDVRGLEASDQAVFEATHDDSLAGRTNELQALDDFARSDDCVLLIRGPSGIGKSALVVAWVRDQARAAFPDRVVVPHYVGAGGSALDTDSMLRRLIRELDHAFNAALTDPPTDPRQLRKAFRDRLGQFSARGTRIVLLIDGADSLVGDMPADPWFADELPKGVQIILTSSTRGPRGLPATGVRTLELGTLDTEGRQRICREALLRYGKQLAPNAVARIAAAAPSGSPRYLRLLLDELRRCEAHELLDAAIVSQLQAPNLAALYDSVLERIEREREIGPLIERALVLLFCSRRGLKPIELTELLGSVTGSLPHHRLSDLLSRASEALSYRGEFVQLANPEARAAVAARYMKAGVAPAAHARLAKFLANRTLARRREQELHWQLARACAWDDLFAFLGNLELLEEAVLADSAGLLESVQQMEASSTLRAIDALETVVPRCSPHELWNVCAFMERLGHSERARALRSSLTAIAKESGDARDVCDALGNEANHCLSAGDPEKALELFTEQEQTSRRVELRDSHVNALFGQAQSLAALGRKDDALAKYLLLEEMSEQGDIPNLLTASRLGRASVLMSDNATKAEAEALLEECAALLRRKESSPQLLEGCLARMAVLALEKDDLERADALLTERTVISRALGDQVTIVQCLMARAELEERRRAFDAAIRALTDAEQLMRGRDDDRALPYCLLRKADVVAKQAQSSETLAEEGAERLAQTLLGIHAELARFADRLSAAGVPEAFWSQLLQEHAGAVYKLGRLDAALQLSEWSERSARKAGAPVLVATALAQRASLLQELGAADSRTIMQEALRFAHEGGEPSVVEAIEHALRSW